MATHEDLRLSTARLTIRCAVPDDGALLAAYQRENREHLAAFSPSPGPRFFEPAFWEERLHQELGATPVGQAISYLFLTTEDGALAGVGRLSQIARASFLCAKLGYSSSAAHQGKGLMTEGLTAALEHAFTKLGLHRIEAGYLPTNERSARLAKRLGFVPFGYAQDYLHIDGEWRDHVLTALTSPHPCVPQPT